MITITGGLHQEVILLDYVIPRVVLTIRSHKYELNAHTHNRNVQWFVSTSLVYTMYMHMIYMYIVMKFDTCVRFILVCGPKSPLTVACWATKRLSSFLKRKRLEISISECFGQVKLYSTIYLRMHGNKYVWLKYVLIYSKIIGSDYMAAASWNLTSKPSSVLYEMQTIMDFLLWFILLS